MMLNMGVENLNSYEVELKDLGLLDRSIWVETSHLLYKLSEENKIELDITDNWDTEEYVNAEGKECYKIIFPEKYKLEAHYELDKKIDDIWYGKVYYNIFS